MLLACFVAACAVGPDYHKPEAAAPEVYKEAGDWIKADPKDAAPKGKWWEAFHDPVLNDLEEQVSVSNQTLAAAEARYRQAHAAVQAARAGFFPVFSGDANAARARATGNRYSLAVDARWEIDLWGKIRRMVEAARATEEASAADVENARLSLQAELATNYFQLRAVDVGADLLNDTVKAYTTQLNVTQNRYTAGVVGKVDVVQAQTQLLSTQAQSVDLKSTRATLEHAIATLMGRAPSEFSLATTQFTAHIPDIPPGLPSTLLERRPDIASAERNMAAANARVGVAEAAFFPDLNLSGTFGYASNALTHLFAAPNRFWSLGADLAGPIFDFGATAAQVHIQQAAYDEQVANYRQAVLNGFQEVEDNLAATHWLAEESGVEEQAVRAARESVVLTVNQYKSGTVGYLNVVLVQAAQLNEERTMVNLLGRRLAATVALMRALGGSWQ
jgi:NodT family efflux transporter outer membrane factor (OMF) lipoprotein